MIDPIPEMSDPVHRILNLLGEVVLIPVYPLTKKPAIERWQRQTPAAMTDPAYLQLFVGNNIGVSLGRASGGLCTIDLDDDADVEPFLADNPRLRDTTRTKRVRGCNLWVFIDGEIPPSAKLMADGKKIGEWRADGNQTVIFGSAIDKSKGETVPTEYKFLKEVQPIHIRFDELVFPDGNLSKSKIVRQEPSLNSAFCVSASPVSLHDCISASLHPLHNKAATVLANITAKKEAELALATKHPNLARLYAKFIEPRFQAQAHARNHSIVQSVPFLYRAVAPQFVLDLVGCFYDCNRSLFHDTRDQHMKEASAMLKSVANTYVESLDADERNIYDALPEPEQVAFRICRDLALLKGTDKPPRTFFMSFNQLGYRMGIFPMQAQRIMRQLEDYGIIKQLRKGTRRAAGVRGEAGVYQWLVSQ